MRKLSARARWAVPAGIVTAVGVGVAASAAASAAAPTLPRRTAAQLIAAVDQAAAKPLPPLTATVQETANLGLPALPQTGPLGGQQGPAAMTNPLAGTTTVNIWYRGPRQVRIAEPAPLGESDLRLDGTQLWLWSSKDQTATHVLLPAVPKSGRAPSGPVQSPAAAAKQLLTAVGPSTYVRVGPTATVAGRAAYQLSIAPKGSGSLVSQILIAIDASSHLPLRVQVFARSSASPAFQLGYTSLAFGAPAASNFTFSPPPGAKVKTIKVPDMPSGLAGQLPPGFTQHGFGSASSAGSWAAPVTGISVAGPGAQAAPAPLTPAQARQLKARLIASLPKKMTGAERREAVRSIERTTMPGAQIARSSGASPLGVGAGQPNVGVGQPKVLGSGWTSVLATPANPAVAAAVQQLLSGAGAHPQTQAARAFGGTMSSGPGAAGPAGPGLAVVRALLKATTAVHGSWGSGRLLRTTLLTVLITSKGQILAGAVTPSVLYADVASLAK